MRTTVSLVLAGGLLGVLASACGHANLPAVGASVRGNAKPAAPVGAIVYLTYDQFSPRIVHIRKGESVEWRWNRIYNPYPSDIVGPGFHSPVQSRGTYYHTFTAPGTYHYHSAYHAQQTGEVIVSG